MASHIGLTSDKNLAVDEPSLEWIRKYADDQALFFRDFAAAYEDVRDWRDVRVREMVDGRLARREEDQGASERSRWDDTRDASVGAAAFYCSDPGDETCGLRITEISLILDRR